MTNTTKTTTTKGAHLYEIGFSYQREEDGELCDFTGEITTTLMDEVVKECDAELEDTYDRYLIGNTQHQWDATTYWVLCEKGTQNSYDVDDMENIIWEYTSKIDKRTKQYKEYRSAA
jgi:hypothetical protein